VPEASLTFPAELRSVGAARRFLRAMLHDWNSDDYDYAAPLVLTELVTNATLHARTPYTVQLRLEPTHLVVEVADRSPRLPQTLRYATDATTGRGITLVNAFSSRWGTIPTADGKVVWAHIRPDEPTVLTFTDHTDGGVDDVKVGRSIPTPRDGSAIRPAVNSIDPVRNPAPAAA
jgi:anti-sigma regulatory factor (Ser/Thr protein kinase)